jgi:hypothetical protein
MEKARVELRDKKSQCYDITQGAGLVSDQVKELYKTPKVTAWIKSGFLQVTEKELNPAPVEAKAEVEAAKVEAPADDLSTKTVTQLKELLKEKGIEFPSSATKAELLALLEA